jgi:hypothetical protein
LHGVLDNWPYYLSSGMFVPVEPHVSRVLCGICIAFPVLHCEFVRILYHVHDVLEEAFALRVCQAVSRIDREGDLSAFLALLVAI